MWDHRIPSRTGEGGSVGPVLQVPKEAAGRWSQGQVRLQGQLLTGMEVQPLGAEGLPSFFKAAM